MIFIRRLALSWVILQTVLMSAFAGQPLEQIATHSYGIEVSSNVLGYSLIPWIGSALVQGLSIYEIQLAGLYPVSTKHAVGGELSYFKIAYAKNNSKDLIFSMEGPGIGPLYRYYTASHDQSGFILGIRMPFKFVSTTIVSSTKSTGVFDILFLHLLFEGAYRWFLDGLTFTSGIFLGYREVFFDDKITLGPVSDPIRNQNRLETFLSGLGFGAQLAIGYVF